MSELSDEDRSRAEANGLVFATKCVDQTKAAFHATLLIMMELGRRTLRQDGLATASASEILAVFSDAAVAEWCRLHFNLSGSAGPA